jgi:flavin-dependent dehydrogenase
LLDKATFPRIKLCAGGLTTDADLILRELGVHVDLPAVSVHLSKFLLPTGQLLFEQPDHFRVIRRDQFDELLFRTARERGVVARDGEEVDTIIRCANEVIVRTSREEYRTKILVGADGANSTARKAVGLQRSDRLMVAMESIVPLGKNDLPEFTNNTAIFDVSLTSRGMPGYCWIFPTVYEKPRAASLGIMAASSRKSEAVPVKAIFTEWIGDHGMNVQDFELKAHPILRYEPRAPASTNRVALTGDAAGIDPLFAEGIFSALALGRITAKSVADALERRDFSFSDYEKRIRLSSIGSVMRRRRLLANRLYSYPRLSQRLLHYGPLLKWIAFLRLQKGKMIWQPYKQ